MTSFLLPHNRSLLLALLLMPLIGVATAYYFTEPCEISAFRISAKVKGQPAQGDPILVEPGAEVEISAETVTHPETCAGVPTAEWIFVFRSEPLLIKVSDSPRPKLELTVGHATKEGDQVAVNVNELGWQFLHIQVKGE